MNNKKVHYNRDAVNGMPIFSVAAAALVTVISILAKVLSFLDPNLHSGTSELGKPLAEINELFPESMLLLVFALLGLMMGFSQFSFLSSRARFYMQMSLGIKRKKLFMNRALGGLILLFICCFAPAVADIVLNTIKFEMSGKMLFSVFAVFISKMSACCVPFLFAILSSLTCSKQFEKYSLGAILTFLPHLLLYLLFKGVSFGIKGINDIQATGFDIDSVFSKADPVMTSNSLFDESFLTDLMTVYKESPAVTGAGWNVFTRVLWVAFALIYLFVLCSEFSEDSYFEKYIFNGRAPFATASFSAGVIIIPVSILVSVISGLAGDLLKNIFVFLIAVAVICIVFVLLPSSKKERIIKLSVCLGVAAVFSVSVFAGKNIKLTIPEAKEIIYASVSFPKTLFNKNRMNDRRNLLGEQYEFDCEPVEFLSETDMEYLTQLLKALENEADNENGKYIQIYYNLNNKKIISRKYRISSKEVYEVLFNFYSTDSYSEYVKANTGPEGENHLCLIDNYEQTSVLNLKADDEQVEILKYSAVEEFLSLSPAERFKPDEKPLYYLGFEEIYYGSPDGEFLKIPVYRNMKKTVEIIDSLKMKKSEPAKIKKISVYKSSDVYKSTLDALGYSPELHSGHGILFSACDLVLFDVSYEEREAYDVFIYRRRRVYEKLKEKEETGIRISDEPIKEFYGNEAKKAFENCFSMYYCPGECEFAVVEFEDGRKPVYYYAS